MLEDMLIIFLNRSMINIVKRKQEFGYAIVENKIERRSIYYIVDVSPNMIDNVEYVLLF